MTDWMRPCCWIGLLILLLSCACSTETPRSEVPGLERGSRLIRGTVVILPVSDPELQEVVADGSRDLPAPFQRERLPDGAVYLLVDSSFEIEAGSPDVEHGLDGRADYLFEYTPGDTTNAVGPGGVEARTLIREAEILCRNPDSFSSDPISCKEVVITTRDGTTQWRFFVGEDLEPPSDDPKMIVVLLQGNLATYPKPRRWRALERFFDEADPIQ